MGVLPIVNENDVVAVDEIRGSAIGDNDNLSALVANLVDADLLVLLTDIDGLYTADPALDPSATLIERVEVIDEALERVAGTARERGTGGMVTKLQAARVATQSGTEVVIASGLVEGTVLDAACGGAIGTRFAPRGTRLESRRRFLLSGLPVRGWLSVDEGAARAVAGGGRSLLPAGIVAVEGSFERGDVVEVRAADGRHLASGAVNYGAEDIGRIRGLRSDRIIEVLGYEYGDEVIHANNLVVV
jgi:glutamate 5-kinase